MMDATALLALAEALVEAWNLGNGLHVLGVLMRLDNDELTVDQAIDHLPTYRDSRCRSQSGPGCRERICVHRSLPHAH